MKITDLSPVNSVAIRQGVVQMTFDQRGQQVGRQINIGDQSAFRRDNPDDQPWVVEVQPGLYLKEDGDRLHAISNGPEATHFPTLQAAMDATKKYYGGDWGTSRPHAFQPNW